MKKCPKCGARLNHESVFCKNCGTKLAGGKFLKKKKRSRKPIFLCLLVVGIFLLAGLMLLFLDRDNETSAKLSQEDINRIYDNYEDVSEKISNFASSYEDSDGYLEPESVDTVLENVSHFAEELLDTGDITDYHYEKGDSCVYMEIDGWLGVLYDPLVKDVLSGADDIQVVTLEPYASESKTVGSYLLSGAQGPDDGARLIEENVTSFSFTSNLDDDEITIDTVRNLPSHSVIVWTGHGSYSSKLGPILCLGKVHDQTEIMRYQKEIGEDAVYLSTSGGVRISSKFFDNFMKKESLEGSLVYFNTCFSYTDDRLANSILDLGAIAYLGNSKETNSIYAFDMVYGFLEGLTPVSTGSYYRPIQEALSYAKLKHGATDWAMGGEVKLACQFDFALPEMIAIKNGAYRVNSGSNLILCDANGEEITDYTMYITKSYKFCDQYLSAGPDVPSSTIISDYDEVMEVASKKATQLNLMPGVYEIVFAIDGYTMTETVQVLQYGGTQTLSIQCDGFTISSKEETDTTHVVETEHTEIERSEKQLAIAKTRFSDTFTEEYIYSYNNSGQLIKRTTISYNNDAKTSARDWDYIYNSDGKMIAEKDSESYYNDFEYHYDGSALSGYTYNDIRENRIVIATTYHFERDAAGNIVSVTTSGTDPDVWMNGKYTYDVDGNRISAHEEDRYGDTLTESNMTYDYSYPGMVVITEEETMLGYTSKSRYVQIRDFEKHVLGRFELLDGYSIKTDKDGYVTSIVDENGTTVSTFVYSDGAQQTNTDGERYNPDAVEGYAQAINYFEKEIRPNYIIPTEKMTATYYCQTYGGMAGQAYATTSTSNLYTLSQIQPWLIAYNVADYNSDRIADLFIITLEGHGDGEIGQAEIKRGIYLFDENGQVTSRTWFNTAASASEKKMVFAFIDDKLVELSFSDYSMRRDGDNATLIEYPITDKLWYHDTSINVKQFNPNTNELEFILSFYRHSYPNSSPSWDSDFSDYETEYGAMLAVQDLLHENYIVGVEMPISDLWTNRWNNDFYLTDEAEWNAFKLEISSSPSEIVYGVELVGGPRYDEKGLLNTTTGTTVFSCDKYELSERSSS